MRVRAQALPALRAAVDEMVAEPANAKAKLHHLLARLAAQGQEIRAVYTTGHWLDVDSVEDVIAAGNFS
jgi:phosphoenolpyruvate phosphomutase